MTSRAYRMTDFSTVYGWAKSHGWAVFEEDVLPTDGIIIPGVCCAWVYLCSNGPFSRLAWPVSNPQASIREVYKGLTQVILELHALSKERGCPLMEAAFDSTGLGRVALNAGFQTGDISLTSYYKV